MRLEPNISTNYVNLASSYTGLNRLDEAEATFKQAAERKLGGSSCWRGPIRWPF